MYAEITDETLRAIPRILDPGQDGYHDTHNPDTLPAIGHLTQQGDRAASREEGGP